MNTSQESEVLINIDNISVEYATKSESLLAIDKINLRIKQGEFICVLGPSGCGKSTLLNVIAGYIKPTTGTCYMKNEPIKGADWHRGVVFQTPMLYPWMKVKENIEFGPKMRGLSKDEIQGISKHFLQQVKLSDVENKSVFELSGGMKQRVALARVLSNYPEVILMDEPFSALDALSRGNMQELVREIWSKNNSTFFLITHDVDEALSLGTRVLVMSKRPGVILEEFNVDFTYNFLEENSSHVQYSDPYVDIKDEILKIIYEQIEE